MSTQPNVLMEAFVSSLVKMMLTIKVLKLPWTTHSISTMSYPLAVLRFVKKACGDLCVGIYGALRKLLLLVVNWGSHEQVSEVCYCV